LARPNLGTASRREVAPCEKENIVDYKENVSERLDALRRKYQETITSVSIQRAQYFTEMWKKTEGKDISINERVAYCMQHVLSSISIYFDPNDHLIGSWTEHFLGIPIDIEKGMYNSTFELELKRSTLITSQVRSTLKFLFFVIKNHGILSVIRNAYQCHVAGVKLPKLGITTIDKRKVNPYVFSAKDKRVFLRELSPYWKGKTVCDTIVRKLEEQKGFPGDTKPFMEAIPSSFTGGYAILAPSTYLATTQGNVVIDNTTFLTKGIVAMKEEVLDILEGQESLSKEERGFLQSILIAYDSILLFAQKLGAMVREWLDKESDPQRRKKMQKIADSLARAPAYPAETLFEAIQAYWIVKITVELSLPFNGLGMGRLDQIFYPFYKRDREKNAISREEARELFEETLLKNMNFNIKPLPNFINDFYHRFCGMESVTIGGTDAAGNDATNELTYIILEAAFRAKTVNNIIIRIHKNTPDEFHRLIADVLYNKVSNVSLQNDELCIKSMLNAGYSLEDARSYSAIVCANFCTAGKNGGEGCSSISCSNLLDATLRNGDNVTTVGTLRNTGIKTGSAESFKTFDEFLDAVKKQLTYSLTVLRRGIEIRDSVFASQLSSPFISAFTPSALIKKRDTTACGDDYQIEFVLLGTSVANFIDSLFAIKKLVFEERAFSLSELVSALDNNFRGYEEIHKKIMQCRPKWGNGVPEIDQFARKVMRVCTDAINSVTCSNGRLFISSIGGGMTHTLVGRFGMATPDGRKAGQPFAAGCSPYNVDTHGPTGVLSSIAHLDLDQLMECTVNLKLHPSLIGKNPESREKWISLIKTYFKMGGMQIQPTIASNEDLRAAQKDPQNYRDLLVKVGGFSVYFTEIGWELQNEIISRTEHTKW
jgi:formate C-acetyltransferase